MASSVTGSLRMHVYAAVRVQAQLYCKSSPYKFCRCIIFSDTIPSSNVAKYKVCSIQKLHCMVMCRICTLSVNHEICVNDPGSWKCNKA